MPRIHFHTIRFNGNTNLNIMLLKVFYHCVPKFLEFINLYRITQIALVFKRIKTLPFFMGGYLHGNLWLAGKDIFGESILYTVNKCGHGLSFFKITQIPFFFGFANCLSFCVSSFLIESLRIVPRLLYVIAYFEVSVVAFLIASSVIQNCIFCYLFRIISIARN